MLTMTKLSEELHCDDLRERVGEKKKHNIALFVQTLLGHVMQNA